VIIRYAGRNRVEDGLGISVNFFHLDCLASEVRLNVDLDATLTVLANGCYRWLASRLRGYGKPLPSSCTAASWKPQAESRSKRTTWSCISTSAGTIRTTRKVCADLPTARGPAAARHQAESRWNQYVCRSARSFGLPAPPRNRQIIVYR
jgi:hypothetical protein